jgi:hypothetical protein
MQNELSGRFASSSHHEAERAVTKAIEKKGWKAFPQSIEIGNGGLSMFDAGYAGKKAEVVSAPLAAGTYTVDVLGEKAKSGPVVFIRLRR